jgi:SAM-dependent methyltransferase
MPSGSPWIKLKSRVKARISRIVRSELASELRRIPYWDTLSQGVEYSADFSAVQGPKGADGFPVPPRDLRHGYFQESDDVYIGVGREEAERFMEFISKYIPEARSLLDFGSSSGRVLRHLVGRDSYSNLVGVDIETRCIEWALANLSEKLKFVPISTFPSLPFEDATFDVVISRSVFTHIRDLALMALLELRRTLRPGGYALITIQDDRTWGEFRRHPEWFSAGELMHRIGVPHSSFSSERVPADYVALGFGPDSMIFYSDNYLRKVWGRFFDIVESTPFGERYTAQSILVLRKPEDKL